MAQNKLKEKVNALTRIVRQMLKDLQQLDSLARGTLTSLQLFMGEKEWDKVVNELKEIEGRNTPSDSKKELEIPEE
tara:strand:+ start:640 stop:867 length:228 start_codon:yes stop_codon:yes gene_type:complete